MDDFAQRAKIAARIVPIVAFLRCIATKAQAPFRHSSRECTSFSQKMRSL